MRGHAPAEGLPWRPIDAGSRTFVLKTLQIKTICPTHACTTPVCLAVHFLVDWNLICLVCNSTVVTLSGALRAVQGSTAHRPWTRFCTVRQGLTLLNSDHSYKYTMTFFGIVAARTATRNDYSPSHLDGRPGTRKPDRGPPQCTINIGGLVPQVL